MQLCSALTALSVAALAASSASAKVIKGFSVPTNITKGEPFNVHFKTQGALSGPIYCECGSRTAVSDDKGTDQPPSTSTVYAEYGLQTNNQTYDYALGTLINGTDLVTLGKSDVVDGDFDVSITIPANNSQFEDVQGKHPFMLALFGVNGALHTPQSLLLNQTVYIQ